MGAGPSNELRSVAGVEVAVERVKYTAGDIVRGYVELNVKQPTTMRTVVVQFSGEANTKVNGIGQTLSVVNLEAVVTSFPGDHAPAGHFQYPFEFAVPADAAATIAKIREKDHYTTTNKMNFAALHYSVGVICLRPGWAKKNLVHRIPIEVANRPTNTEAERTMAMEHITNCGCFSAGHIGLAVRPCKSCFFEGDPGVVFECEVDNQSSQTIDFVDARLIEQVWWSATSANNASFEHVSRTVLSSTQLQGLSRRTKFGFDSNSEPAKTISVDLPASLARCTTVSPTIHVTLLLELEARCSGVFAADPFLRTPVQIARNSSIPSSSSSSFSAPSSLPAAEDAANPKEFVPFSPPAAFRPDPACRVGPSSILTPTVPS